MARIALVAALAVMLTGCAAASVATGTVGAAGKVAGAAVDTTGHVVSAVIP